MTVVTRFAPSPTGYLHIGGARTALYSWLYAKKMQGKFILRIEDTDTERSTQASVEAILTGMAWLGLEYDEGPYYQTQRFARYQEVAEQLLSEGKAYRCYCSKERLESLRSEQMARKEKPRYDGRCRSGTSAQGPHVLRFKNPLEGVVEFEDLIRGKLVFNNTELDDLIIVRSDGAPTYNFTVVVDDWDMQVTHVIRGDDHINNTPRQMNILRALQALPPVYAHLPMILGADGKRLSKREGAASVMDYREAGILPEALLNYLVRLGWSHGDQEIFSLAEMIDLFEIADINKAPAALNPEKLLWLNQHYLKTQPPEEIAKNLDSYLKKLDIDSTQGPSLVEVVKAQRERVKTLKEMAEKSQFFYKNIAYDPEASNHLTAAIKPPLAVVYDQLQILSTWSQEAIHGVIEQVAAQHQLKLGKLAQPLRVAVTGGTISPPIDLTLQVMGRELVTQRLQQALQYIN